MLFTSVCTALLAAAQLASGTPVYSENGVLTTRQVDTTHPTCVQGLITPFNKTDVEALRTWFQTQTPDANDFIAAGGWYTWELGTARICIFNTNPNGTTDVEVNHKAHAACLEQTRDTCCSPTADQCRAGRAPEYAVNGALLGCRVTNAATKC